MKICQLILTGIIFISSCSSPKRDFDTIELISYNYITYKGSFEQRCYLYTIINPDGNALFFRWKKHSPTEAAYSKATIEESLIDSILVAAKRQKEYLIRNNGIIGMHDGPLLAIKIKRTDGSFELIDFELGDVLFKYLETLYDKTRLESSDSIEINRKKMELQNLIWEKDSSLFNGKMTRPFIPDK